MGQQVPKGRNGSTSRAKQKRTISVSDDDNVPERPASRNVASSGRKQRKRRTATRRNFVPIDDGGGESDEDYDDEFIDGFGKQKTNKRQFSQQLDSDDEESFRETQSTKKWG